MISMINEQIREINTLKKRNDVLILSHYYMSPELQVLASDGGIADHLGDSLALSLAAANSSSSIIVFCGVRFMAETAKILNPHARVYIPDQSAGCSLAESINASDVRALRESYPGVPIIAYINTYAETKAECDIICTSRNALSIAASFKEDTLLFIPDLFMGNNLKKSIAASTGKKLLLWDGRCEVHEQFQTTQLASLQDAYPHAELLMHWEVPDTTVDEAFKHQNGVLGSTSDILRYVGESKSKQFILASECDLGAVLKSTYQDREFITPCIRCPHMKKITLANTLELLRKIDNNEAYSEEVRMKSSLMNRARIPLEKMLEFS